MSYYIKYKLSFVSDRDNDYELHILQKNYGGQPIVKKLGVAPTLSIEEGDGNIKGSSLSFSIQADMEGELRGLYTTDNKEFKVLLYRNSSLYWQGYLLPELYSEQYVDAPYDVSVTATDGLATLKVITYEREDVNVSIATVVEDILSLTQLSLPLTYHMSIAHAFKKEYDEGEQLNPGGGLPIPMLTNTYISQAAYNGFTCYDVLNQILLSCNCCLMQIGGEWLVMSLTDSSENYYSSGANIQRKHKMLGQLGIAEVYPSGSLTLVNSPALKGANVEYSHMMRKSFFANPDCVDRRAWTYADDSRNPYDIPGEKEAFGKIFKAHCFELHPNNISKDNTLQLWQEVALNKDDDNFYELAVKYLFGNNAKLLLLSITYYGDDGIARQLTAEGWVAEWDKADVNSYIQITGQNKSALLDSISDIEQYEMAKVQFSLPGMGGTIRVGFINSTLNYADPLAYAPIYVTQVYLTVGGISGQQCTTEVEPNATQEPQGVLLAYGDTFESANAYKLETNTLKRLSGENIASWWLNGRNYPSYYDAMLQEYSRYFGTKKVQLQGAIMGENVLHGIYVDTHSGKAMRLVTAQMDLLSDEASVTLEEIVTVDVEFTAVVYATNNTNSFGTPSSGGGGTVSGGSSSVDTSHLLGREEAANTYATKAVVEDLGNEVAEVREDLDALNDLLNDDVAGVINTWDEVVDFLNEYSESQDLASILSQMNADIANRVLYEDFEKLEEAVLAIDISGLSNRLDVAEQAIKTNATAIATNATNITNLNNRVKTLEDLGLTLEGDAETGYYIKSAYSFVSQGEIISGRRASGSGSGGGGGISEITAQMVVDALGYIPYSSLNPAGYITASALNGYATEAWVSNNYQPKGNYLTSVAWGDVSGKPTTLGGYGITDALSTSGGTITGGLSLNQYLRINAWSGYGNGSCDMWYNGTNGILSITAQNITNYWGETFIHLGNIGSYAPIYNSNGNVGIGTTSPATLLDVRGEVSVSYAPSGGLRLYNQDRNNWSWIGNSVTTGSDRADLVFADAKGVAMRIIDSNVLIGTASGIGHSYGRLQVYETSNEWGSIVYTNNSSVSSAHTGGYGMLVTSSNNNNGTYLFSVRYNDSSLTGAGLPALYVKDNGNILIGTQSDSTYGKLQIQGNGVCNYGELTIKNTDSYGIGMSFGYDYSEYGMGFIKFKTPATNIARPDNRISFDIYGHDNLLNILGNGNVLIGTTSDNGAKLQVDGDLTATGEVISSRRASSSDARLKDNINRLIAEDCLAMVRTLQPSSWDWKENGEHSMGFVAQDIEPLMPYAVTRIKDDVLGQRLNLQYDQFLAPVVGAIQCLDSEVEQLKKRVKYLENKLQEYGYNRY